MVIPTKIHLFVDTIFGYDNKKKTKLHIFFLFYFFLFPAVRTNSYPPENPLGNWSTTNPATAPRAVGEDTEDLRIHSKLELQKLPQEMLQPYNNKEQNGSTIILTPTSLTTATPPPTTMTTTTAGGQSGNDDADGEYKGPKW